MRFLGLYTNVTILSIPGASVPKLNAAAVHPHEVVIFVDPYILATDIAKRKCVGSGRIGIVYTANMYTERIETEHLSLPLSVKED